MYNREHKPRLEAFLGRIEIIPQEGLISFFERAHTARPDFESQIRDAVVNAIALPRVTDVKPTSSEAIGIDIHINELRFGGFISSSFFPIIWRPSVTLRSRIFRVQDGETIEWITVTETAGWKESLNRLFSIQFTPGNYRIFYEKDIEPLILRGSVKMLKSISLAIQKY